LAEKQQQPTKVRNQHYVSRFYLKHFADPSSQLFYSFNKQFTKPKTASVAQSAQEEFFYDFHPSTLQSPTDDVQWVEKTFGEIETRFKPQIDEFLASAAAGGVTSVLADRLAVFVAYQWLRTKSYRLTAMEIDKKTSQALVNQLYAVNDTSVPPGKYQQGEGYAPGLHAQMIFDSDRVLMMASSLRNLLWVIGHNNTEHLLYTSDTPVARRANCEIDGAPAIGIFDPGIEYAYPLTSKFVLHMMDRHAFPGLQQYELKTIGLPPEQVERYNTMQVMCSTKYVFCQKNDFALAKRICDERPDICNPDRERVRVDSTLSDDGKGWIGVTALE
jgi:hypothetical protein